MTIRQCETTAGPVVVDGRTLALVSKTRLVSVDRASGSVFHVRSRPSHIEILDVDGRREIVPIRDVHRLVVTAIAAATGACIVATRLLRSRA